MRAHVATAEVVTTPVVPAEVLPDVSLRLLAREALIESDNDVRAAIGLLVERLNEDKRLLKEIVAEAVLLAADSAVREQVRRSRSLIMSSAASAKGGVIALANGMKRSILDFELARGLMLRNAFPHQVGEQIEYYKKTGNDVLHKARWLALIVKSVPADKRIGDVVTDKRAQELWVAANNERAA